MGKPELHLEADNAPTEERLRQSGWQFEVSDNPEKSRRVLRMRDYPLANMLSRETIDQAQYKAGERFHWACVVGFSDIKSLDPGRIFSPAECTYGMAATEVQAYARKLHREAVRELGIKRTAVLQNATIMGMTLEQIGFECLGMKSRRSAIRHASKEIHTSLEVLVDLWRLGN